MGDGFTPIDRPPPARPWLPKSSAAAPWLAGILSLLLHGGVLAAFLAEPSGPPVPLPAISVSIVAGPPGGLATERKGQPSTVGARSTERTRPTAATHPEPASTASKSEIERPTEPTAVPPKTTTPPSRKVAIAPAPARAATGAAARKPSSSTPATPTEAPLRAVATKPVEPAPVRQLPKTLATSRKPGRTADGRARPVPHSKPVANQQPRRRSVSTKVRGGKARATRAPARERQAAALPGARTGAYSPPRAGGGGSVNRPPVYPRRARRLGWQGRVVVRVRVDARGRVVAVRLGDSSGHGILDRAALDAVRGWRFAPARRGAIPVAAWVDVPIRFRLTGGS